MPLLIAAAAVSRDEKKTSGPLKLLPTLWVRCGIREVASGSSPDAAAKTVLHSDSSSRRLALEDNQGYEARGDESVVVAETRHPATIFAFLSSSHQWPKGGATPCGEGHPSGPSSASQTFTRCRKNCPATANLSVNVMPSALEVGMLVGAEASVN